MQESIDESARDQRRDGALFIAPSGRHQNEFRKLCVQSIEKGGCIAAQCAKISDENSAAAADEEIDRDVCGLCMPERVLRA